MQWHHCCIGQWIISSRSENVIVTSINPHLSLTSSPGHHPQLFIIHKLQHLLSGYNRFMHNTTNLLHRVTGNLNTSEFSQLLLCIKKRIQLASLVKEIQCLEICLYSKITVAAAKLCPILDSNRILRIRNA